MKPDANSVLFALEFLYARRLIFTFSNDSDPEEYLLNEHLMSCNDELRSNLDFMLLYHYHKQKIMFLMSIKSAFFLPFHQIFASSTNIADILFGS